MEIESGLPNIQRANLEKIHKYHVQAKIQHKHPNPNAENNQDQRLKLENAGGTPVFSPQYFKPTPPKNLGQYKEFNNPNYTEPVIHPNSSLFFEDERRYASAKEAVLHKKILKMRDALVDKEEVIVAHRALIKRLYYQIQNYENNMRIMRHIIKTLKKELMIHNHPLPEINGLDEMTANLLTREGTHMGNYPNVPNVSNAPNSQLSEHKDVDISSHLSQQDEQPSQLGLGGVGTTISQDDSILLSASMVMNYDSQPLNVQVPRRANPIDNVDPEYLSEYDKYILQSMHDRKAKRIHYKRPYHNLKKNAPVQLSRRNHSQGPKMKRKHYSRSTKPSRTKSRPRPVNVIQFQDPYFEEYLRRRELYSRDVSPIRKIPDSNLYHAASTKRSASNLRPNELEGGSQKFNLSSAINEDSDRRFEFRENNGVRELRVNEKERLRTTGGNERAPLYGASPSSYQDLIQRQGIKRTFESTMNTDEVMSENIMLYGSSQNINRGSFATDQRDHNIARRNFDFYGSLDSQFRNYVFGDIIISILDCLLLGEEMQTLTRFLLGNASKLTFINKTRSIIFNTIAFYYVLKNISFNNSLDSYLPRITEMICSLFEVGRCIIYLYDSNSEQLIAKTVSGPNVESFAIPKDSGLVGYCFNSGQGLILKNPYEDKRFDRSIEKLRKSITKNIMIHPLKLREQPIGCIEIANKRFGEFFEQDYKLMSLISQEMTAGFLLNSKNTKTDKMKENGVKFDEEVSELCNNSLLRPLLKNMIIIVADAFKSEKTILYLADENHDTLISELSSTTAIVSNQKTIKLDLNSGCAGKAFSSGEIVFEANVNESSVISDQEMNFVQIGLSAINNIISVPIINSRGKSIGVLEMFNCGSDAFETSKSKSLLQRYSKYLSLLIYTNDFLQGTIKSYETLSVAFNYINDSVFVLDGNSNVIKVNKSASIILRQTEENIVGRHINEIFGGRNSHLLESFYRLLDSSETQVMDNTYISISYKTDNGMQYMELSINFYCLFLNINSKNSGMLLVVQPIVTKKF